MNQLLMDTIPQHRSPATTSTPLSSAIMCGSGIRTNLCGRLMPLGRLPPRYRCQEARQKDPDFVCESMEEDGEVGVHCIEPREVGVHCIQPMCLLCMAVDLGRICCTCSQLVHPNQLFCDRRCLHKCCRRCWIVGLVSSPPSPPSN